MTDLVRRFRGMGVALVVLALSAGAVFAAAPRFAPASETAFETTETTETSETTQTTTVGDEDGGDEGGDVETPETSETSEMSDGTEGTDGADTHGELVSTAAQMPTPAGFPNHGAFVSCVAHMGKDVLVSTIVWANVTPESCGIPLDAALTDKAKGKADKAHGKSEHAKGKSGAAHGKPKS